MDASSPESKVRRFPTFKRVFCWRTARFVLLGLATLITLFVLYHAEENWRGKRAWMKYRVAMEAKGAVFDLKTLIPPPVPEEQNFAMTPLLKPVLDLYTPEEFAAKHPPSRFKDTNGHERATAISTDGNSRYPPVWTNDLPAGVKREYRERKPDLGKWLLGERTDLAHWQFYYRSITNFPRWPEPRSPAEDVLKALSRFDAELAELREAGRRPHARFNVAYEEANPYGIMLPHLAVLKGVTRVACLGATAELALGKVDPALEDVMLALKVSDSVKDEPLLISHLVRIATLQIALQTVWEGLQDHRWNDAQLQQLEARLRAFDVLAEGAQALRGERAFGTRAMEWLRQNPARLAQLGDSQGDAPLEVISLVVPRGWFYFEQRNYNRLFDEFILADLAGDPAAWDVAKIWEKAEKMDEAMIEVSHPARAIFGHYILSRLLLPAVGRVIERSAVCQVITRQAIVALALERHRIARGNYPESLDPLVPEFLKAVPFDPITRKPFHYRRTNDGRFVLYSVGWNQQDDGGNYVLRDKKQRNFAYDQGDWIWPVPATEK